MFKKYTILSLFILFFGQSVYSQIITGGTFGFGLSNNYLSVDVAPEISYMTFDCLQLGVSPFVLYNKNISSEYWMMMYGGRFFAEYRFDFNIFVHAEFEAANVSDSEGWNSNVYALPIGVGGISELSDRMEAYAVILYDVIYDEVLSTRSNPIVRVGIRYTINREKE